jgi:hypothetical protein
MLQAAYAIVIHICQQRLKSLFMRELRETAYAANPPAIPVYLNQNQKSRW